MAAVHVRHTDRRHRVLVMVVLRATAGPAPTEMGPVTYVVVAASTTAAAAAARTGMWCVRSARRGRVPGAAGRVVVRFRLVQCAARLRGRVSLPARNRTLVRVLLRGVL